MSQLEQIEAAARKKLAQLDEKNMRRRLYPTKRGKGGDADRGGRKLISFCDNDYLGLSTDDRVIEAAADAARQYGAGAGASRLVAGECPLNGQVEDALARLKTMPAARIFGSGYLANIGALPVLAGKGDLIVMDELSHACLHAGAKLSGADIGLFCHNDVKDAARALQNRSAYDRVLVVTETVFSMDGDIAPLAALNDLCHDYNAWLMTDDAHGFGVVKMTNPAPVQMGTLSKAVGAYGGYVCGPAAFIDLLNSRARSLIYTTGLPPAVLGAALSGLEIMEHETTRGEKALAHAAMFAELVGLKRPQSAIVPFIIGDEAKALSLSDRLSDEGYLVSAIRPPTVPAGTARLRFTFNAGHRAEDVRELVLTVKALVS